MRFAIVEDNPDQAAALKDQMLALLAGRAVVSACDLFSSCSACLQSKQPYDLYIIDCLLPDGNGVELAKSLRETHPDAEIIFTTAHLEYAANGYETDALRYLLKPVKDDKLLEALNYFLRRRSLDPVIELTGTTRFPDFVKASRILYIEYADRRVLVRLASRTVETQKYIRDFEKELPDDCFFRTSRSFLVNLRHISEKQGNTLIISNGERVTLSKRRLSAFNQAYLQFLKQKTARGTTA